MPDRYPTGSSFVAVVDVETTATDEPDDPYASILEVGIVLCRDSPDLVEVGRGSALVRPPGDRRWLDAMWAQMPGKVQAMHERSGLWAAATTGATEEVALSVSEVDEALAAWLVEQCPGVGPKAPIAFAGSGVSHYDDRWLRVHMPRTRALLTYWSLDAGVVRRVLQYARRDDLVDLAGDVDAKPHRALDDAVLHAGELRRYLGLLATIPAADQ